MWLSLTISEALGSEGGVVLADEEYKKITFRITYYGQYKGRKVRL